MKFFEWRWVQKKNDHRGVIISFKVFSQKGRGEFLNRMQGNKQIDEFLVVPLIALPVFNQMTKCGDESTF